MSGFCHLVYEVVDLWPAVALHTIVAGIVSQKKCRGLSGVSGHLYTRSIVLPIRNSGNNRTSLKASAESRGDRATRSLPYGTQRAKIFTDC